MKGLIYFPLCISNTLTLSNTQKGADCYKFVGWLPLAFPATEAVATFWPKLWPHLACQPRVPTHALCAHYYHTGRVFVRVAWHLLALFWQGCGNWLLSFDEAKLRPIKALPWASIWHGIINVSTFAVCGGSCFAQNLWVYTIYPLWKVVSFSFSVPQQNQWQQHTNFILFCCGLS